MKQPTATSKPAPKVTVWPLGTSFPHHPAAALFPMLDGAELDELAGNIRAAKGLLEPIVLLDGKILDGRNRYCVCLMLDMPLRTVEWDGEGGTPVAFVWGKNGTRRHLTPEQRAWIALDMLPAYEAEAQKRRQRGTSAPFGANEQAGKAAELAAHAAKVSPRMVERAKAVRDTSPPKVLEAVKQGDVTISDAAAVCDEPEALQLEALNAVIAGKAKTLAGYLRARSEPAAVAQVAPAGPKPVLLPGVVADAQAEAASAALRGLGPAQVTNVQAGDGFVILTFARAATPPAELGGGA